MIVLDAMEKCAGVTLTQAELNDSPGVCLKVHGGLADVESATAAARQAAEMMGVGIVAHVIARPSVDSDPAWLAVTDFNPLIEQATVHNPGKLMKDQASFAVGLIETQGFAAVFEAIDTALKTAAVEVIAREKLGGGFITVVIKGDVAAVRAAVDAGKARSRGTR